MIKQCVICGNEFEAKTNGKSCSIECKKQKISKQNQGYYEENKEEKKLRRKYKKRFKEKIFKLCVICGNEFNVKRNRKTCSKICSDKNKANITNKREKLYKLEDPEKYLKSSNKRREKSEKINKFIINHLINEDLISGKDLRKNCPSKSINRSQYNKIYDSTKRSIVKTFLKETGITRQQVYALITQAEKESSSGR